MTIYTDTINLIKERFEHIGGLAALEDFKAAISAAESRFQHPIGGVDILDIANRLERKWNSTIWEKVNSAYKGIMNTHINVNDDENCLEIFSRVTGFRCRKSAGYSTYPCCIFGTLVGYTATSTLLDMQFRDGVLYRLTAVRDEANAPLGYIVQEVESDATLTANTPPPPKARHYGKILSYSTNPLEYVKGFMSKSSEKSGEYEKALPFYGVELEINPASSTQSLNTLAAKVHDALTTDFAILKSDGSIGNGFEIVTAPATLAVHKEMWLPFFKDVAKQCKSWSTDCCGMHVHISRDAFMSPIHLGKMIAFYNAPSNRHFIERIAGRDCSRWAGIRQDATPLAEKMIKGTTSWGKDVPLNAYLSHEHHKHGKFLAVNLCKPHTVEIRIFKGNVAQVGFFKNLEFVDAVFQYAKEMVWRPLNDAEKALMEKRKAAGSTGQEMQRYGVHYNDFLQWLRKDKENRYPNLKLWLSKNGVATFKTKQATDKTPEGALPSDAEVLEVA